MSLTASADDAPAWSIQNLKIYAIPRAGGGRGR